MAILRQRTSFGPGIYRGHKFDLARLRTFVDGTNKAIAAGVPIPLLLRHAPINANDEQTEQFASEPDKGAGFITRVDLDADGNMGFEADVPTAIVHAKDEGALKFTSPEFRSHYECEKAGVYSGPVIRHFAFTPTPGNPHQGVIETVALQEQCFQFSEEDRQPLQFGEDDIHVWATPHGAGKTKGKYQLHSKQTGYSASDKLFDTHEQAAKHVDEMNKKPGLMRKYKFIHPHQYSERDDSSYTGSMAKPTHDEPNSFGKSEGKSIDWDTLAPTLKNKVLDAIKAGNNNTASLSKLFDITGACAECGVAEYNKFKERNNMSQHSEQSRASSVLSKHGWNKQTEAGGLHTYAHPSHEGHVIHVKTYGAFDHLDHNSHSIGSGEGTHVLGTHLSKFHSGSQHAEAPPFDKKTPVDKKEGIDNKDEDSDVSIGTVNEPVEDTTATNPDMPPKATDKTKLAAIIAGLKLKGMCVPSDWNPDKDGAMDILLATLNTSIDADNKAQAEDAEDKEGDDDNPVQDAPMPFAEAKTVIKVVETNDMQFTEDELALMPPALKAKLELQATALKEANAKALQFAEAEKVAVNNSAKDKAIQFIESSHIPVSMKTELKSSYDVIQFSEGDEEPSFTAKAVAEMFSKYIPKHLQFDEQEIEESVIDTQHGVIGRDAKGNPVTGSIEHEQFFEGKEVPLGHVSSERARKLVDGNPHLNNRMTQLASAVPSISELVAKENERVPNNVRGKGY